MRFFCEHEKNEAILLIEGCDRMAGGTLFAQSDPIFAGCSATTFSTQVGIGHCKFPPPCALSSPLTMTSFVPLTGLGQVVKSRS